MMEPSVNSSGTSSIRTLSLLHFSIMVFVVNCGGPYGLEYLIQTGGPLYTFLALLIVPFVFSLPQSLACAELNSMMPCNHGFIVWIYRGLGEFWGWINACNCVLGTTLNLPIFAVLMVDYFVALFNSNSDAHSWFLIYFLKLLLVFIGMIFCIMNIKIVGRTMVIFTIIILTPFLIGFIWCIPDMDPINQWTQTKAINADMTYNWPVFISSALWLHCGFDRLSCITGETKFARNRFFMAFVYAIILDFIAYTLPLIAALTVDYDNNDWNKGYLLDAYDVILPGIKYFVLFGGVISMFSLYVVELSAYSRMICSIAQPFIVITNKGKIPRMNTNEYEEEISYLDRIGTELRDESNFEQDSDYEDNELFGGAHSSPYSDEERSFRSGSNLKYYKKLRVSICPLWIGHYWTRTGAPLRAVLIQSMINCILVAFSFNILIQIAMFFFAISWLLEFASFIRLKYTESDAHRPFVVPFGMFGAWFITIIKLIVIFVVIVVTTYHESKIFFIVIGYNLLIIVLYGIRSYYWQKNKLKFTEETRH